MHRHLLTALVTAALLVLSAAPALAHAGFLQSSVPADSDQTVTMRVPGERTGQATVKVETLVPATWDVLGCVAPPEFACGTADRNDGSTIVTFTRQSGVADTAVVYTFQLHTPDALGTYEFPTIQTYNGQDADGSTEAPWTGDLSPTLEVTGEGTEPQAGDEPDGSHDDGGSDAPEPDDAGDDTSGEAAAPDTSSEGETDAPAASDSSTAGDPPASDDDGTTADEPATSDDDAADEPISAGDATSDDEDTVAGDDEPAGADTTSESDDPVAAQDGVADDVAAADLDADPAATEDGGGAGIYLAAVALLAAGAGAVVWQRRRA